MKKDNTIYQPETEKWLYDSVCIYRKDGFKAPSFTAALPTDLKMLQSYW